MTENINNNENKVVISKEVRKKVWWRHQFLQGVMNYERMQNGGWAYSISPALEEIYTDKEDQSQALKRHLEFYNTHPYVSNSVMGVTLAMEEERANGADIDDGAINGVKIGLMGPLAGVGDPVFWFTIRPILGALGASLALTGNIVGPLIFFLIWNAMRLIFEWKSQEFGYRTGNEIIKDLSGGLLGRVTLMASILGMFIIGALVQRWVSINFTINVSSVTQQPGTYIDWAVLPAGAEGIKMAISKALEIGPTALDSVKVTTLQQNLDSLIPGLSALLLTLGICKLLKKNISPIVIILSLFVVGILARVFHIM